MSSSEATAATATNAAAAVDPVGACPAKKKSSGSAAKNAAASPAAAPATTTTTKKRSKSSHTAAPATAAPAAGEQPAVGATLADAILAIDKKPNEKQSPVKQAATESHGTGTKRKHDATATSEDEVKKPPSKKKRAASTNTTATTTAVASPAASETAAAPAPVAAAKKESSSGGGSGNLHVLIRHHGKIPFAKPVVIEWSPLPVLGRGSNYKPNPSGKPTERYQYLRLPASEDIVLKPLACQLVDMNYGIQFVGQNAHQVNSWSVHNWEPLMNEGVTVSYAEPIQQNIRLLVQNCSEQKVVIKQGDPLAIVRFHPLAKKLSLHYVPLSQ